MSGRWTSFTTSSPRQEVAYPEHRRHAFPALPCGRSALHLSAQGDEGCLGEEPIRPRRAQVVAYDEAREDWLERIDAANLVRSMPRKASSQDNAACEGFFGRLKTEFFYPRDWRAFTVAQFVDEVDALADELGLSHAVASRVFAMAHAGIGDLQLTRRGQPCCD